MSDSQAKKMLAAVKGDSVIALRDKAIIVLALTCGLRTCEISRAVVGDFKDYGEFYTLDVIGKRHVIADTKVKIAPIALK